MKITLLVDNKKSWVVPCVLKLKKGLEKLGHQVVYIHDSGKIPAGDCAFFLACEKIIPKEILLRNQHNLVVHESALPKGKGWSPLTWQILEGKNEIPITLFEAVDRVDSGPIYLQDVMCFKGHELLDELHEVQGEKTIELVLKFVKSYPPKKSKSQLGKESFYLRRTPEDSELDVNRTIAEQFNLLRVVDNKKYPAFSHYKGKKYIIQIRKISEKRTSNNDSR